MRILLAQNSFYYPAHGGGDRSNRLLMEALAERGHLCRAVARISRLGEAEHDQYLRDLAARLVEPESCQGGVVTFHHEGVEVHVVTHHPNLRAYFSSQMEAFAPDIVLASTDDPAQVLLEASLRAGARTVYLARATLALPFGPDAAFPSSAKTEALRQCAAIVGVSHYVADYIRQWSGIPAAHVPISLLDSGPYPSLGRFENEFVTLVNPCAVKGISIFLELADRMPASRFLAVPTWGTNRADRETLARRANITVIDPVDNVDEILRRTSVLLVPSLWAEARSRMIVEAMLRGVPVIASNIGGIPEAKLGLNYLIPVRPITHYGPKLDERMVPVADTPPQDVRPWQAALTRLLSDRAHYEALSRASRDAAQAYAANLSVVPFESLLQQVMGAPAKAASAPAPSRDNLSPEKRKLLALRVSKLSRSAPAPLRLICFPHAGGGATTFYGWEQRLPASVITLVHSPQRRSMAEHVAALAENLAGYLDRPFAFFGHSMGAAVAFEVARLLRRTKQPLPQLFIASAARAPQFRRGHVPSPEPSDAEFIAELRRLEGTPATVLESPRTLEAILPMLRADAALYRTYVYSEEPPLGCPIRAYGGADDPHIRREHLEAWREQSTASFEVRMFPGGHFYLETARDEFLQALSEDLKVSA
jgi:surfactin synthase thioesterase subunit/glycosyltransferase involved in cell wall biosynthesis